MVQEKRGYTYRKEASSWTINYEAYLVGQGGSGKTTRAIRVFPSRKVIVLTLANLLVKYYRKQNPGLTAMKYHKYFHLKATPIDEWDPACLGKKALAEILIFDEACMIPKKVLQRLLSYAESRGCQNIMCGDPGQLTPWGDKEEKQLGEREALLKQKENNIKKTIETQVDEERKCLKDEYNAFKVHLE
ncbi:17423_t:CDS:2, partial [Funneliformis geosporum]